VFNQQLLTLLEAGQPITEAISVLRQNDRQSRQKAVYDSLLTALQQGKQLSAAMALLPSVFPQLYVAMVEASETTGTVQTSIRRFMQYQAQSDEIRSKLNAAAIYPAILSLVGFTVIAFLLLYVAPKFSVVFEDMNASKRTAASVVQWWGTLVRTHTALAWGGFIATLLGMAFALFHPALRLLIAQRLRRTPWIGERIQVLQMARLYRTLGMLLNSGISIIAAMRMTTPTLPFGMQPLVTSAMQAVSEGKPLSRAMAEFGLSTDVAQRLTVAGESSGNLGLMLSHIADFFEQETARWLDRTSRLIEPALMVVIGLIIGLVVLMLYSPIFDLGNAI
jgi:general secretion pathway protein F